jgi:hypothetical protein
MPDVERKETERLKKDRKRAREDEGKRGGAVLGIPDVLAFNMRIYDKTSSMPPETWGKNKRGDGTGRDAVQIQE